MVEAALKVERLVKHYPRARQSPFVAVDGVSFEVYPGECFGLLGPNGAGKSTSINCIIGFYPPTQGRILIEGHDVHLEPKSARVKLGVCSQEDTLDTDFDVLDQMVRYATFYGIPPKEAHRRAEILLERFQLTEWKGELVESLSGGMRRKLQVARAMVSNPKVLVLDEPTTGLDPDARRILWDVLIQNRKEGIATLLSTHYMEEAERLCDRIAIMHRGKLLDIAPPQALIDKHVGQTDIDEEVRPGIHWRRRPNLEDVFLKLAGSGLNAEPPQSETQRG